MANNKLIIIAGPCVIESKALLQQCVETLLNSVHDKPVDFYFKSSYKKANRTSFSSFIGIGDETALNYLYEIGKEYNVKTLTDIHSPEEAVIAAEYVDVLQIPAFLSRQSELLIAAAKTGKQINIKKAQFMAPDDISKAAAKVKNAGNNKIWFTERGTSFGYHDLIVDFRSMLIMKEFGYPVIYDATHSLQKPSLGEQSGGLAQFVQPMAKAAITLGIDGIFFETHPNPESAKSDSATQLKLSLAGKFISDIVKINELCKTL